MRHRSSTVFSAFLAPQLVQRLPHWKSIHQMSYHFLLPRILPSFVQSKSSLSTLRFSFTQRFWSMDMYDTQICMTLNSGTSCISSLYVRSPYRSLDPSSTFAQTSEHAPLQATFILRTTNRYISDHSVESADHRRFGSHEVDPRCDAANFRSHSCVNIL